MILVMQCRAWANLPYTKLTLVAVQEIGLSPIMWQLADLARWVDPAMMFLFCKMPKQVAVFPVMQRYRCMAQGCLKGRRWSHLVASSHIASA